MGVPPAIQRKNQGFSEVAKIGRPEKPAKCKRGCCRLQNKLGPRSKSPGVALTALHIFWASP